MIICKLCSNKKFHNQEKIKSEDIEAIFRANFNISLPDLYCQAPDKIIVKNQCLECDLVQFTPDWIGSPQLYEALQIFPWYYQESKAEFNVSKNYVKPTDRVLEVGCGAGNFRECLPSSVSYCGLEFNKKAIERAVFKGLDVQGTDLENFSEDNNSKFDCVFAFQVLEHVPEPKLFLEQMLKTIKVEGYLIFSVPSESSFLKYEINNVLNFPPHHATRWTDKTFQVMNDLIGTRLIKIEHEKLGREHLRAYAKAQFYRFTSKFNLVVCEVVAPCLNKSIQKLIINFCSVPFLLFAILFRSFVRGHTVTVVLQKVENKSNLNTKNPHHLF